MRADCRTGVMDAFSWLDVTERVVRPGEADGVRVERDFFPVDDCLPRLRLRLREADLLRCLERARG